MTVVGHDSRRSELFRGGQDQVARDLKAPYRPDIDGLRAVAVLLVVGYHGFPDVFRAGFVGVDVFFVISGYLITGNILREMRAGTFTFLNFYARRMRRIVPALAVVLAGVLAIGAYCLLPSEFQLLGRHAAAGALFVNNIVLWREAGYFDAAAEAKPLLHLWSLGIEEQFYLLWPPLLLIAWRNGAARRSIIAVVAAASFVLNVAIVPHHAAAAFYLLPSRFWELLAGALLARPQSDSALGEFGTAPVRNFCAWLGSALLIATATVVSSGRQYPGWWATAPVLASCLMIAAGPSAWVNRAILSTRVAVGIGLISYPLYLWHWPLLSFASIIDPARRTSAVTITCIALAFVLAWSTYRFVERPAQRRWFAFARSRGRMVICVSSCMATLLLVAAAGSVVRANEGFPEHWHRRFPNVPAQLRDLTFLKYPAAVENFVPCAGALQAVRTLSWCNQGVSTPATIALYGDSHALYLFPGFAKAFAATGQNAAVVGESGCAPILNVRSYLNGHTDKCAEANREAVDALVRTQTIRTIVLSSLGPYYFSGVSVAADHTGGNDAAQWNLVGTTRDMPIAKDALFEAGYDATISELETAGKRVVLFIDVPELDFQPSECVDVRPIGVGHRGVKTPCGMPRVAVTNRQAGYRTIIADLADRHPRLRVFDPLPFLCDSETCFALRNGRLLYRDSNHLSAYGSEYLASRLAEWMTLDAPH